MVCDPSQNNINISGGPYLSLPGMGLPFSVPKIPFPDLNLPFGPEDLLDLLDRIFALFPQGIKFVPNADSLMKDVWDALASIFNQIAPFLAMYKFIQALLNMILCIIDILCALSNPWATARAIKRLFKRCLPDFLSLFPWLALLIMILALILLLIALIEYLIQMIRDLIEQLIRNLTILTRAITVNDEDSILAAVNKIAYLLCLFEQLFSILAAVSALFAILRPLMGIMGQGVCSSGAGSSCCSEDFCPSFITNSGEEGPISSSGRLIYHTEIGPNYPDDDAFSFLRDIRMPPQRSERWQFVDDSPENFSFTEIITPSPEYGFTYWPEGESYESDANTVRVPYLVDMNIELDPRFYGNSSDLYGARRFNIRDAIVKVKPTTYPQDWKNDFDTAVTSGSISIGGGTVWEYNETGDGYVGQYFINGEAATLETLITKETGYLTIPETDDSVYFYNIEYNLKINHEVLVDKKLVSNMCQPDLALESAVLNAEFNDLRSVFDKVGDLPDVGVLSDDRTDGTGAVGCLARALTEFRSNITEDTANEFVNKSEACLNTLKDECIDFYCRGALAAADRYNSTVIINPNIQFINRDIDVTVELKDKTGGQLAVGVSEGIGSCISKAIKAEVTLGEVTPFEYDGYGDFVATITSDTAGEGELTAYINNEYLAQIINRDNEDLDTEIIIRTLNYEFIDKTSLTYRRDQGDQMREDFGPSDVAEDGA